MSEATQSTPSLSVACPICKGTTFPRQTKVQLGAGFIHVCSICGGFFLYPPNQISYEESWWTEKRVTNWEHDADRGRKAARIIRDYISGLLGRPMQSVLEIGCGSAFMGVGFKELGCRYVGIDVDQKLVEMARSRGIEAHAVPAEQLRESPPGAEGYDLILSSNTIEHVEDPPVVFRNIRESARGVVAIIVPNARGLMPVLKSNPLLRGIIQKVSGSRNSVHTIDGNWHNIAHTEKSLRHLCATAGLVVNELRSMKVNDPVFGFVQPNPSLLYRLVEGVAGMLKSHSELLLLATPRSREHTL